MSAAVLTHLQFGVNHSMAESAFHVSRPSEQRETERDVQLEQEPAYSKKWGRKQQPKSSSASSLMRADAPDFEWPQPWDRVWADACLPSAASAHNLIERTNKLWQSELVCVHMLTRTTSLGLTRAFQASLRPLWFGARSGVCPTLSCVVEVT